ARAVVIYRAYFKGDPDPAALQRLPEALRPGCAPPGGGQVVRIPLRLRPGEAPAFRPEDVLLHPGDLVYVESQPVRTVYTAGQALARYFTQNFNFTLISRVIQTNTTTGTINVSVP